MATVTLILGMLLPAWLGAALLALLNGRRLASAGGHGADDHGANVRRADSLNVHRAARGDLAWLIGCGWLAGILLVTFWMRALSAAGVPFGILVIGGPLVLVAAAASGWVWMQSRKSGGGSAGTGSGLGAGVATSAGSGAGGTAAPSAMPAANLPWQRWLWWALVAWIAVRFGLLLIDVAVRPLFPWDAWSHWATKARVWFELKSIVPFVPGAEWFPSQGGVYTDYNPAYPATIPLFQVWGALLLGRWDDTLINVPWWLTGVALALAVYGFLAERGLPPLWALVGTWFVASLPFIGVHIALAGYADLPMAAYLSLSVLAAWRWTQMRRWDDLILAILFAAGCVLTKNPGKLWILVLVPGLVAALLPRFGVKLALAGLGVAIAGVVVLSRLEVTILGYSFSSNVELPWRALVDAYLVYANWHLLWYGALAVALLCWRQLLSPAVAPLTVVILYGILLLMFGFTFTSVRAWVEDQSTVNRATLHLAPLLAVWSVLVLHAWARQMEAKEEAKRVEAARAEAEAKRVEAAARAEAAATAGAQAMAGPATLT